MTGTDQLSLEISGTNVSAVSFTVEKRSITVTGCYSVAYDAQEKIFEAVAKVLDYFSVSNTRCLVCFSPDFFFFRTLSIPFSDQKQVSSVLNYELQDSVILTEGEYIHTSLFFNKGPEETGVLALLLEKILLKNLLKCLKEKSLDPEVVTISGLSAINNHCRLKDNQQNLVLIDVGQIFASVYLVMKGKTQLIRSLPYDIGGNIGISLTEEKQILIKHREKLKPSIIRLASNVRTTVSSMVGDTVKHSDLVWYISGIVGSQSEVCSVLIDELGIEQSGNDWSPYSVTDFLEVIPHEKLPVLYNNVLALGCDRAKDLETVNFRKNEFVRKEKNNKIKKTVKNCILVMSVFLLLGVIGLWVEYRQIEKKRDAIVIQLIKVYRQTIPGDGRIVDPLQQLSVKVNELKQATSIGKSGAIDLNTVVLFADISKRIPNSLHVKFERLIYDRKTIRIKGITDNFNMVDQMKKYLSESPFFAEVAIVSANVVSKDQGVKFELRLQL